MNPKSNPHRCTCMHADEFNARMSVNSPCVVQKWSLNYHTDPGQMTGSPVQHGKLDIFLLHIFVNKSLPHHVFRIQ